MTIVFAGTTFAGGASTGADGGPALDARNGSTLGAAPPRETDEIPMNEDIDALLERVSLDFRPYRVWWRDGRAGEPDGTVPGPTDRYLVATLQLDAAAFETLEIALEGEPGRERLVDIEPWMAPALRARGEKLHVERHDATRFVRRPYTQGNIDRVVGTDFVVLRLGT